MLNFSKKQHNVDSELWLRQYTKNGIPLDCEKAYYYCLNQLIAYYKSFIDEIITYNEGYLEFPMQTTLFENYLSGYQFNYIGFDSKVNDFEGYWVQDNEDDSIVYIFYNINSPAKRQRFTVTHELFHFSQSLDTNIQKYFDNLLVNSTLPRNVVTKLIEKATDKATSMYLMPNDYFVSKYTEVEDVFEVAEYFQVSQQTARYRLKECNLPIF